MSNKRKESLKKMLDKDFSKPDETDLAAFRDLPKKKEKQPPPTPAISDKPKPKKKIVSKIPEIDPWYNLQQDPDSKADLIDHLAKDHPHGKPERYSMLPSDMRFVKKFLTGDELKLYIELLYRTWWKRDGLIYTPLSYKNVCTEIGCAKETARKIVKGLVKANAIKQKLPQFKTVRGPIWRIYLPDEILEMREL